LTADRRKFLAELRKISPEIARKWRLDPSCVRGLSILRRFPFLNLGQGRRLLLSLPGLIGMMNEGFNQLLRERVSEKVAGAINHMWGRAHEEVVLGGLRDAIVSRSDADVERDSSFSVPLGRKTSTSIDLTVVRGKQIALIEMKSWILSMRAMERYPQDAAVRWLDRALFGTSEDTEGAISQLNVAVHSIRQGRAVVNGNRIPSDAQIFPVIVLACDLAMEPVLHTWLEGRLCQTSWPRTDQQVARPMVTSIRDLFFLETALAKGADIFSILDEKAGNSTFRVASFGTFLHETKQPYAGTPDRLVLAADELLDHVGARYFPQAEFNSVLGADYESPL